MTFYMPKLVLIGSLWLLVVSLSCWQELQQLWDPTYDYQFDTGYAAVYLLMLLISVADDMLYYLRQGGYVFARICLSVCLAVC